MVVYLYGVDEDGARLDPGLNVVVCIDSLTDEPMDDEGSSADLPLGYAGVYPGLLKVLAKFGSDSMWF